MASLCLPSAELHVGVRWGEHAPLAAALADPSRTPILLYPGQGARDILADPPVGPVTLIVVDGTWSQAKTVVRDNPILHALPRYAFTTPEPSRYRIRREPDEAYVSTIEALMHVLGVLEGEPERFRAMLAPLDAMVDAQLACQAARPQRRLRNERPPTDRRKLLPSVIAADHARLVLVAGEANAWPYRATGVRSDELVHWVAYRPTTGATFEAVVAPQLAMSPSTTFHTGLTEERLRAGCARDELLARFAAFLSPGDVVGSWGHYATNLWSAAGGAIAEHVDLRAAAQRFAARRIGSIEDHAASIPASDPPFDLPGRGGRRLAALARIVAHWRSL
jgi:hypothetical protein